MVDKHVWGACGYAVWVRVPSLAPKIRLPLTGWPEFFVQRWDSKIKCKSPVDSCPIPARRNRHHNVASSISRTITGHQFWYHGYRNGCPVSFWKPLICKSFSIRFNETRLCGDVRSSPQSLVLFYRGIPFNERSEVCPLLGKVCSTVNYSFCKSTL